MKKKPDRQYVKCAVCGGVFVGRVPKGGDGSLLFPYRHRRMEFRPPEGGSILFTEWWVPCDGNHKEGKLV